MHPTTGTAAIYRLADGSRILRFTNFRTSNGPDVHVYLVAAADARDTETVKRVAFIDLGTIKGNIGDQNYALGADLDLSKYRTVSIWCKRFAINFGAAPLRADHVMSQTSWLSSRLLIELIVDSMQAKTAVAEWCSMMIDLVKP